MMGHTDLQGTPTDNYWNVAHASNGCSQTNAMASCGAGYIYRLARS